MKMTIREYAKKCGHEVAGKLTPIRKGVKTLLRGERMYADEAGNEYVNYKGNVVIITADGGVI